MPQMSNRKFCIIMQTVCIFRVIVVGLQDNRIPRRQLAVSPVPSPLLPCSPSTVVMVARVEPRPAQSRYSFATPCIPPWPVLIIIEFLENFTVKGKGNSPRDFCISLRQRTGWQCCPLYGLAVLPLLAGSVTPPTDLTCCIA